jgi:predicted 2-oxoglutarate/Fe(II)-dependent dioxygenase YbiX
MYIVPKAINPTEIVGGCIAIYENIWENPEETIKEIELITSDIHSNVRFDPSQTKGDQATGDPTFQSVRTNYDLSVTHAGKMNETFRKLNNRFYELTNAAVQSYSKIFDIHEDLMFREGFNLLKYSSGQSYIAHYDGNTSQARSVSPILYLNDEYSGGEIEFVNFGITIKPKAGMLVVFPSNYAYRHIAHPVQSGTKYAIVTWLHDQ